MDNEMKIIYEELKECISDENIKGARAKFDTVFLFYNHEIEFLDKCIELCESIDNFYDDFDNAELKYDSKDWSEEYLDDLLGSIPGNFSKERVHLLIEINKYLKSVDTTIEEIDKATNSNESNEEKICCDDNIQMVKKSPLNRRNINFTEGEERKYPVNFQKAAGIAFFSGAVLLGFALLRKRK